MRAVPHHASLVEDDDAVGIADGSYPLGDDDLRRALALGRKTLSEGLVGREVERGERVVEDEGLGLTGDGAGDGEALALAS